MRYRIPKISPKVPTASMADIAFLLIIFFMLTTSFSPDRRNVALPLSQIQDRVTEGAAIVAITEAGDVFFTTGEEESVQMASLQELGTRVGALVQSSPSWEFLIKADRGVPFRAVDDVLDVLRTKDVRNIGLLTRPRPLKEPN